MVDGHRADRHIFYIGVEARILHLHAHADAESIGRLAATDRFGRDGIVVPGEIRPQILSLLIRKNTLADQRIEERTAVLSEERRCRGEHAEDCGEVFGF